MHDKTLTELAASLAAGEFSSRELTENLLARIEDFKVAARTSSFRFRGTDTDVRTIGADLNVRLVLEEGLTISQVCCDLGISTSSLSRWVQQAEIDAGRGEEGALTTDEKDELRRLRRENAQLRMEREILKKAAAFFAKENQ